MSSSRPAISSSPGVCESRRHLVIELGSRRIVHSGATTSPTDHWTVQQLCEATCFGEGPRFLIRDNDNKHGASLERVAAGIEALRRIEHQRQMLSVSNSRAVYDGSVWITS